ncbi:MAG: hypothetical protein AAF995_03360 [Planctomycetota bacterium]
MDPLLVLLMLVAIALTLGAIPLVGGGAIFAYILWRSRPEKRFVRTFPATHCTCGYTVEGLKSDTPCPECGEATPSVREVYEPGPRRYDDTSGGLIWLARTQLLCLAGATWCWIWLYESGLFGTKHFVDSEGLLISFGNLSAASWIMTSVAFVLAARRWPHNIRRLARAACVGLLLGHLAAVVLDTLDTRYLAPVADRWIVLCLALVPLAALGTAVLCGGRPSATTDVAANLRP